MKILAAYPFPGNVRELSNVIEQAVALAAGPLIEPHDMPDRLLHPVTQTVWDQRRTTPKESVPL